MSMANFGLVAEVVFIPFNVVATAGVVFACVKVVNAEWHIVTGTAADATLA